MRKVRKETAVNPVLQLLRPVVAGAFLGAVICTLLLVGAALIMSSSGKLPQSAIPMITLAVSGVSSLAGGFLAAKLSKARGLLFGACTGLLLFFMEFLAGLSILGGDAAPAVLTKCLVMVLAGAIGGLIAVMNQKG